MSVGAEKIIRLQADRLARELGLEEGTFFEMEELELISTTQYGAEITIKGVKSTASASRKALADIILMKIKKATNHPK